MKKASFKRVICLLLCLCMLLSVATATAMAEELTEKSETVTAPQSNRPQVITAAPGDTMFPEAKDTLWEFDFTTMGNTVKGTYESELCGTISMGATRFELAADGMSLAGNNKSGTIRFYEPKKQVITSEKNIAGVGNSFLAGYGDGCLIFTLEFNFAELPSVTASAPNENVLSFITWEHKYYASVGAEKTTTGYARFLCVDENGYLYNNDRAKMSDTHRLVAGEDAKVTIVMDPDIASCIYDLYLNDEYVFSGSVPIKTGVSGMTESCIRIADTRRQYDLTVKKASLHSVDPDYRFGAVSTADWVGYQTGKVMTDEDGKSTFDVRLISLIDTLDYPQAGYEITQAYSEDGKAVMSTPVILSDDVVYTELRQTVDGRRSYWSAEDNGGKYILAMSYEGMDALAIGTTLRVRPFALRADGLRVYGRSQYMTYEGLGADGRPFFSCSDSSANQTLIVEEDTYVRFKKSSSEDYESADYNDSAKLQFKWNVSTLDLETAINQPNTRFTFLHFDLSKLSPNWASYSLMLTYSERMSNFTGEVYEVDVKQVGNSLVGLTGKEVRKYADQFLSREGGPIFTYSLANTAVQVDITRYIQKALAEGKTHVIWRLEYNREEVVEYNNSNHAVATLYSKENGDLSRAPTIVGSGNFNYETNLETYGNAGYEPWGYAELLVEDWYKNIWGIYARDYGYSIVNGTADADSKAYVADDYALDLGVKSGSAFKNIQARTVKTIKNYNALATAPEYDGYGGLASDGGKYYNDPSYSDSVNGAPGYFGTYYDKVNNRWWFITPEGNRHLALGICTVSTGSSTGQKALAQTTYGDQDGAAWTSNLLNKIGLNTSTGSTISEAVIPEGNYVISTHSGVGLIGKYGSAIGVNASEGGSTTFANKNTMNVFDPDFVDFAYDRAASQIGSKNEKAYYLGWTSDNEIPANSDLLIRYLTLDTSVDPTVEDDPKTHDDEKELESLKSRNAYSYATAWTWLRKMTGKANPTLEDARNGQRAVIMGGEKKLVSFLELFRGFIYYRYYSIASDAVKTAAPNQLYLGCRELGGNYQCESVMRVAGVFCDVVTLNLYLGANPSPSIIDNIHKWACKPAYVTEFYAKSAGLNSSGSKSGTQAYGVWEVVYDALISPTAATYYTVDTVKTTLSGDKAVDTYYADGTALYKIEYSAKGASAGSRAVSISAYIAKGGTTVATYYIANGKNTYRAADGKMMTVPEVILTNNRGAGKVVRSQDDRGVYYETFALKMLESGFCVGWSWYRYQDNDMPLFYDDKGNLVYFNQWIDEYRYWTDEGTGLTLIHKGENGDQSNLDANKGIVNNAMEEYTEFTSHISNIANNLYGLAEFFDTTRRN